MLPIFDGLRDITLASVTARMLLAFVCGGLIGIEREFKRRPAGFRTHILICLGAAMTTLTSEFLYLYMHYYTDIARFGAQVIAGVGFIGAGAIIVTKRQRVKGLTTAAGMWTAAIIGLVCGAGYYEGAIVATALVLIMELFFSKLEYRVIRNTKEINIFTEYESRATLELILQELKKMNVRVTDLEVTRSTKKSASGKKNACAVLTLQMKNSGEQELIMNTLTEIEGVLFVEEL
jgi:putative Mg2+ transporter-C (MgtC) family protein